MTLATMPRKAVQPAQRYSLAREEVMAKLGNITGPVPRYLYSGLDEDALASEIVKRWSARRMQMATRIDIDHRLMRFVDPEQVQDHWQNFWTGVPLRKLQHSNQLAIAVINWPRALLEATVGLVAGGKPMPYQLDVRPFFSGSPAEQMRAQFTEDALMRWQRKSKYELGFLAKASNVMAIGRNWTQVTTSSVSRETTAENVWPASVAAFWKSIDGHRWLESAIVLSEMLPGEAAELYPDKVDAIARAVRLPSGARSGLVNEERATTTWDLNSTVTVLTCWYRTNKDTIGQAVVLLGGASSQVSNQGNSVMLKHTPDTGYTDLPLWCTARFKTNDRPPDEAQGILYDIAPLATQYDEVYSASRDMLWRAIYQRYVWTNAYGGKPPTLMPGTSIYALRAGQTLTRLDDVLQNTPVEMVLARIEDLMLMISPLSRHSLNANVPTETSGEAIAQSLHASISRIEPTRTEFQAGETWMYGQVASQQARWGSLSLGGVKVSLGPVMGGDFDYVIGWLDISPKDATKAKQLDLAAHRAGIIALDTAQKTFGVISPSDETRKIRQERQDLVMRPDAVALTGQARSVAISAYLAEQRAKNPQPPPADQPRKSISVSGVMSPQMADMIAHESGAVGDVSYEQMHGGGAPGGAPGGDPQAMSGTVRSIADTMSGQSEPPMGESDNERDGMGSMTGGLPGAPGR